jgi:hypothetical protein
MLEKEKILISINEINIENAINDAILKINFTTLGLGDTHRTMSVKISDPYFDIPYSPETVNVNCIDGINYFVSFTIGSHFGKHNRLGFKGGVHLRCYIEDCLVFEKKFFFYKNYLPLRNISQQYPMNYKRLWIIGDSNAWGTFGNDSYTPEPIQDYLPIRYSHPSLSLHRFLNKDNKSFIDLLPIEDGDIITFYLGEIDTRYGLPKTSNEKNKSLSHLTSDLLFKYKEFLQTFISEHPNNKVIVMSPNPPIKNGIIDEEKERQLIKGTNNERKYCVDSFDEFFSNENFLYFNWKKDYTDSFGFVDPNFLYENDFHIKEYDQILKSFNNFLSTL